MTIYGEITILPIDAGTAVVVLLLVNLIWIELGIQWLEKQAELIHASKLFEKVKKSLMMMGLTSFAVFIAESVSKNASSSVGTSVIFAAFDVAHVLFTFVAFSFVIQALFLVQYAATTGNRYLLYERTTAQALVESHTIMVEDDKEEKELTPPSISHYFTSLIFRTELWRFENLPFWMPTMCIFRENCEFKIIERSFLSKHPVPDEFDFARYVGLLFQEYIAKLGNVSAQSWLGLAVLVLINFFRAKVIDPLIKPLMCPNYKQDNTDTDIAAENVCLVYSLQFAFICLLLLCCLILSLHLFSGYYLRLFLQESIEHAFEKSNASALSIASPKERSKSYMKCMESIAKHEQEVESESTAVMVSTEKKEDLKSYVRARRASVLQRTSDHNREGSNPLLKATLPPSSSSSSSSSPPPSPAPVQGKLKRIPSRRDKIEQFKADLKEQELKKEHEYELRKRLPFFRRQCASLYDIVHGMFSEDSSTTKQSKDIFMFHKPSLYFASIEFSLLLQDFYIACYLTQMLPLALRSANAAGWIIALTLPFVFNFFVFRMILSRSVLLQSMTILHPEIVSRVCEDVLEEETVKDAVRFKIYESMEAIEGEDHMIAFIREQFHQIDQDHSNEIDKLEFRDFLGALHVHLSKRKFDILWRTVDFDLSGSVEYEEIFVFVFPQLKSKMKQNFKIIETIRNKFISMFNDKNVPEELWEQELQKEFAKYADESAEIHEKELKAMLKQLGIVDVDERGFALLMSTIDVSANSLIHFDEFKELVMPKDGEHRMSLSLGGAGALQDEHLHLHAHGHAHHRGSAKTASTASVTAPAPTPAPSTIFKTFPIAEEMNENL